MKRYTGDTRITLSINGEDRSILTLPGDTLLRTLRAAGYTGTKIGCENGDCGACTILVDGLPRKSCCMLTLEAVGHRITTVEGLIDTPVQKAFVAENGLQCGYCTPGFVVNTTALLGTHPDADDGTTREWLESNICRCTGYEGIRRSVGAARAMHTGEVRGRDGK